LQELLDKLNQPLTSVDFETLLVEARTKTRAFALDESQPTPLRHLACDVHNLAMIPASQADVEKLKAGMHVLVSAVQNLEEENQRLKTKMARVEREEAPTDINSECAQMLRELKAGAVACNDFDQHFGADTEFELTGAWLADYFNGERARGQAVEPRAKKTNGNKFARDTLAGIFNACHENPKPGSKGSPPISSKGDFLEMLDRWCSAKRQNKVSQILKSA
jgi:hypothetical protein